jgi:hypothetical protein
MMAQIVERAFGRRDYFDIVTLKQCARAEGFGGERVGDAVSPLNSSSIPKLSAKTQLNHKAEGVPRNR